MPAMPAHQSNPVAAAVGGRASTIPAALAAASAGCGFAAIAVAAYAGHPSQWIATVTFALFGAAAGAACVAVQAAFDARVAHPRPRGDRAATAGLPDALASPPAPAALQAAPPGEAAQPA